MTLPIKRKLTILQGATFRKRWTWKPGGVPMDFTGCKARMQVRAEIDGTVVLLELTTENGGIVLGAEPGAIDLYISATDTTIVNETHAQFVCIRMLLAPHHSHDMRATIFFTKIRNLLKHAETHIDQLSQLLNRRQCKSN
jgi:hypothetical protein